MNNAPWPGYMTPEQKEAERQALESIKPTIKPCPFCGLSQGDGTVPHHDEKCFFTLMKKRSEFWMPNPGVMEAAWNRRLG